MIEKLICLLLGHKYESFPKGGFSDFNVCKRCGKSVALSPFLTRGEIEWLDTTFIEAISDGLIARRSEFMKKDE